jgi:hypothetical protein
MATRYQGQNSIAFWREPAAWVAVVAAGLMALSTIDQLHDYLSKDQVGAIVAVIDGVAALITAWKVRPLAPTLFTYIITGIAALATAYGANINPETVAGANAFVVALVFALTRMQQTPTSDPVPLNEDGTIK